MGDTVMKWNLESVTEEARKYSSVRGFKYGSSGAYKWAVRNDFIKEVTAFMKEVTDPMELLTKIRGELGSAARDAKVAKDITDNVSDFYVPTEHDPEQISAGTYLDFEAQMYDQCAEERSDRALDHLQALQKYGTAEQIREAWDLYLLYQTGEWKVEKGCTIGIDVAGKETGRLK
jgi:hypothetical protein